MPSILVPSASAAPQPEVLRRSRILARGVPPALAVTLADLAFPLVERDHAGLLASLTASRCAACTGARS